MNDEPIPTRRSLLDRLKDWKDQESWRVFFETYWKLIYNTAIKAGLTDAEAQDVVQETVLSVSKSMPKFEYSHQNPSFKTWLLRLTHWRVTSQFRKRQRGIIHRRRGANSATGTATVERLPDPAGLKLEAIWEEEWETNLIEAAIDRVKRKVDPKHYQAFDLYTVKRWPVSRVAQTLNMNPAKVYLIKHRLAKLIKKEINYLRTIPI